MELYEFKVEKQQLFCTLCMTVLYISQLFAYYPIHEAVWTT